MGGMTSEASRVELLTVTEVARRLRVTPAWIRFLCARHDLGCKLTPRLRLLSLDDCRALAGLVKGRRRRE